MKYGIYTNKGSLKVRRKCDTATVKVWLHSTEQYDCAKRALIVLKTYLKCTVRKLFFGTYSSS